MKGTPMVVQQTIKPTKLDKDKLEALKHQAKKRGLSQRDFIGVSAAVWPHVAYMINDKMNTELPQPEGAESPTVVGKSINENMAEFLRKKDIESIMDYLHNARLTLASMHSKEWRYKGSDEQYLVAHLILTGQDILSDEEEEYKRSLSKNDAPDKPTVDTQQPTVAVNPQEWKENLAWSNASCPVCEGQWSPLNDCLCVSCENGYKYATMAEWCGAPFAYDQCFHCDKGYHGNRRCVSCAQKRAGEYAKKLPITSSSKDYDPIKQPDVCIEDECLMDSLQPGDVFLSTTNVKWIVVKRTSNRLHVTRKGLDCNVVLWLLGRNVRVTRIIPAAQAGAKVPF